MSQPQFRQGALLYPGNGIFIQAGPGNHRRQRIQCNREDRLVTQTAHIDPGDIPADTGADLDATGLQFTRQGIRIQVTGPFQQQFVEQPRLARLLTIPRAAGIEQHAEIHHGQLGRMNEHHARALLRLPGLDLQRLGQTGQQNQYQ